MLKPVEEELRPFSFEAVIKADRAASKRFILIDVGRDSKGCVTPSLERVKRKVKECLALDSKQTLATTKLYIVGDWNYVEPKEKLSEVSWTYRAPSRGSTLIAVQNEQTLADAQEWKEGVDAVRELIRAMGHLKELM